MQKDEKKVYEKPELVVYGDVEKITAQLGTTRTDVPQGAPCGIGS
jgi:hypothetical protein